MAHVEIVFKIVALMAGIWALSEVRQAMRSFSSPFLFPLFLFLIFQNIVVLVGLVATYCCANILGTCLFYPARVISRILGPFAFFGVFGRAAALALIVLGFLEARPSRRLWIWLGAGLAGLTVLAAARDLGIAGAAFQAASEKIKIALYAAAVTASLAAMAALILVGYAPVATPKNAVWSYPWPIPCCSPSLRSLRPAGCLRASMSR